MSTEEEKEETINNINIIDFKEFYPNILVGTRSSYISQLLMYQWLWKKFSEKYIGLPLNVTLIPEMTATAKSIMDKIEEFNRAHDEEEVIYDIEVNVNREVESVALTVVNKVGGIKADEIVVDECKEITLEDLEKELNGYDDGKEVELEFIHGIGDWHVGRGVDSIWWKSELEQNPHQEQDDFESAGVTRAGDSPREVVRQMNEAMEREGEPMQPTHAPIRRTPNQMRLGGRSVGHLFLAHQRRSLCNSCERIGCSRERCEKTTQDGECAGFVGKDRYEKYPNIDCVICGSRLDSPEQFPKGFPDKWKACCLCVETWSISNGLKCNLVGYSTEEIEQRYEDYYGKFEEVFKL